MKSVALEPFVVVGIEARTSNAAEMSFEGVIPDLWNRFMHEGLAEKIPDRADDNVMALYTDYESDDTAMYTIVLGAKVNAVGELPEGVIAKQVPASSYSVFESPRGPLARIVFETWEQIWKDKTLDRSYKADFEVYGPAASNPRDGQIEIYVGIK
jgi:predicted transcriptional regulator YdeE